MTHINMLKATIFKYNIVISYFSTSRDEYFLTSLKSMCTLEHKRDKYPRF